MMLENPTTTVLKSVNALSYLFVLTALAAGIAWIVYVAKAVDNKTIGEDSTDHIETTRIMFQATVVSILLYFVARHHFRSHY